MSGSSAHIDDDLVFLDESTTPPATPDSGPPRPAWRVMIVDDDTDVHSATTFALSNLEMQRRPLEFLHAYSAAEARELLALEKDIAVILLDVVMEQEDSGLSLVRYIRETLKLSEIRIILRTGQPGYAPEIEAIRDYDINDYKTKSELTRIKLYTAVTAAIRSYEQIRAINAGRRGLDCIVHASIELMALRGLNNFAAGVLIQVPKLLGFDCEGVFYQRSVNRNRLELVTATNAFLASSAPAEQRLRHAETILQRVLTLRSNLFNNDSAAFYLGGDGHTEFALFIDTPKVISDFDRQLLEVFIRNISVGLDNVLLVSHLRNAAFSDPLTKLPNRIAMRDKVDQLLQASVRADNTLAVVDIDHFSETNDALGHQFGDMLLLGVSARLQSRLGKQLTVGRIGSDTFAIVGPSYLVDPAMMLELFNQPFDIDGQQVQVSATAGLVHLCDYEGNGADALKDAAIALKRAKQVQRSGYFYFSRSMGVAVRERVQTMHALRTAIQNKELFLVYQPQIDLESLKPVGAEALLRWRTKDGTIISPDRFVPIAEFSGLIIDIGEQVMREACTELVRLRSLGFTDFTMSVNVSQMQFRHPRFLDTLRAILEETQAPPSHVELEITESIAMEDPEMLIQLLEQIKQTGVSIAIDDFGTGFSSLSYLQQLKVDRLKIDRMFVTEITSSARGSSIAEMVIQLGRNLGLSVVAEGVEDERQAHVLHALGCPYAQGYLFARPMEADQMAAWLQKGRNP